MKKIIRPVMLAAILAALPSALPGQTTPAWVQNLEQVYPSREWVAVNAQGSSQASAEQAAMNALARAFKTSIDALTQTSRRMNQVLDSAAGKTSVSLEQAQKIFQEVNTSASIRGLIGVQTGVYRAPDNTVYANARMNRRESAARYSGMIQENVAVISRLLAFADSHSGFDAYSALSFAAAITIGIVVDTAENAEAVQFRRAFGAFFTGRGFKINEQGRGNYVLRAAIRFEELTQSLVNCRYYLDAALEDPSGTAVFTSTGDERKSHPRTMSEARRLAVRAVETSIKEGAFAQDFDTWLTSLVE
jgi:flavin-binding protein dodecin